MRIEIGQAPNTGFGNISFPIWKVFHTLLKTQVMATSPIASSSIRDRFSKLDLKSAFDLVFSARKGVKPRVFYEFADSIKMPEKNLAALLNISGRHTDPLQITNEWSQDRLRAIADRDRRLLMPSHGKHRKRGRAW